MLRACGTAQARDTTPGADEGATAWRLRGAGVCVQLWPRPLVSGAERASHPADTGPRNDDSGRQRERKLDGVERAKINSNKKQLDFTDGRSAARDEQTHHVVARTPVGITIFRLLHLAIYYRFVFPRQWSLSAVAPFSSSSWIPSATLEVLVACRH